MLYIYTSFLPSGRGRALEYALTFGREMPGDLWCCPVSETPTHWRSNNDARLSRRLRVWQCHRARNEVERGLGGGLEAWGRLALERRGRETSGSLEQRKRPTMREDRRPHRPEPERLTARIGALRSRRSLALSLRRSLWRVERSGIPTLSAPAGGTPASWLPGRLCGFGDEHGPQRSEDRAQGGKDTRPGGIAARYNQAEGLPRSGGTGLF